MISTVDGAIFLALERHLRSAGDVELTAECFPTPSIYLPLGDYPETDLEAIAAKVAARLPNLSPAELLRSMGEGVPSALRQVAPNLVPRADSFEDLIAVLERATPSGPRGVLPRFAVARRDDGLLTLTHWGSPSLCRFDEGLMIGLGQLYGESVALRHPTCRARGEEECVFVMRKLRTESSQAMKRPSGPFERPR